MIGRNPEEVFEAFSYRFIPRISNASYRYKINTLGGAEFNPASITPQTQPIQNQGAPPCPAPM
jgi:hypothetical protein